MTELESRFDADIRELIKTMHESAKARGESYFPSRLFEMVNSQGAVAAVNACVLNVGTTGYKKLCALGLQDCTLEQFVKDNAVLYKDLLTEEAVTAVAWSLENGDKI